MTAFTKIENTWDSYLASGEELEKEFLALVNVIYPESFKIEGNYKYFSRCRKSCDKQKNG